MKNLQEMSLEEIENIDVTLVWHDEPLTTK